MKKRKLLLRVVALLCVMPFIIGIMQYTKKVPAGTSIASDVFYTNELQFLYDATFMRDGERVIEQTLMNEALTIIDEAEQFVVVDMFLYNDDYDRKKGEYPQSAAAMTNALIEKRKSNPTMPITVITDNINTLYGSNDNAFFEQLKEHNIDVVLTNMKPMRDSNLLYSSVWRSYLQWLPVSTDGFLPNAFNPDGPAGSFGSYFDMLNFKANHRKIVMNEQHALITSANLTHDGSTFHSNIGFVVDGGILQSIYEGEQAIAHMSGHTMERVKLTDSVGEVAVQYVTEGEIENAMLEALNNANIGARVNIGVFYIADRHIVEAIEGAAERGAHVQLILDPNKDAFGIEKNGIPNRQVAAELQKHKNIAVRWYETNGEQYHSKFLYVEADDSVTMIGGSANFTRRNIADYNLESNIVIKAPATAQVATDMNAYFERLWTNEDGTFTASFDTYEDKTLWKKVVYRLQEWTGLSTF